MSQAAKIELLEVENDTLRARVTQLESVMGAEFCAPLEWRLTPSETRILGLLYARERVTKDAIMTVLYREWGRDEAEIKIVDVLVCKLRKKLKPFGISIQTRHGVGYGMTQDARDAVRSWIERSR